MNREDFEIFDNNNLIYFDNSATTMKPREVVNSIVEYYTKYTANAHRGDYDNSLKVDEMYEGTREKVRKFINASDASEIVFTSGSTDSFNLIIFGYLSNYLKENDEVILDKSEHASNLLPWLVLSKRIGFKIRYAKLDAENNLTVESIEREITPNTKVISIAHITNTIGDVRDIKTIGRICNERNILYIIDATQSVGHMKLNVQDIGVDFLGFSAHKMFGPTGVGVLYGKKHLLENLIPLRYGGGMNADFASSGEYELKDVPTRFEAGTQNIAGVIGLGAAVDYLERVGLDRIHEHEVELRKYLIERLEKIDNIKIYNRNVDSGIVLFNIGNYFAQDVAIYLNEFKICIRAGNHCAKMLHEVIGDKSTCRISLSLYNTKEEIDLLIDKLKDQDRILDTVV